MNQAQPNLLTNIIFKHYYFFQNAQYNPRPLDGGVGDMERELHGEGMRRIGEIGQSNEGAARMDGEGMDEYVYIPLF